MAQARAAAARKPPKCRTASSRLSRTARCFSYCVRLNRAKAEAAFCSCTGSCCGASADHFPVATHFPARPGQLDMLRQRQQRRADPGLENGKVLFHAPIAARAQSRQLRREISGELLQSPPALGHTSQPVSAPAYRSPFVLFERNGGSSAESQERFGLNRQIMLARCACGRGARCGGQLAFFSAGPGGSSMKEYAPECRLRLAGDKSPRCRFFLSYS